jgi:hypothetical protein
MAAVPLIEVVEGDEVYNATKAAAEGLLQVLDMHGSSLSLALSSLSFALSYIMHCTMTEKGYSQEEMTLAVLKTLNNNLQAYGPKVQH